MSSWWCHIITWYDVMISYTTISMSWYHTMISVCHDTIYYHDVMLSYHHDIMIPWCDAVMLSSWHIMMTSYDDMMMSWYHMRSWDHDVIMTWYHDNTISWCHIWYHDKWSIVTRATLTCKGVLVRWKASNWELLGWYGARVMKVSLFAMFLNMLWPWKPFSILGSWEVL